MNYLENFHKQNNNYTVVLRGNENGQTVEKTRVVTCVEQVVDCTQDLAGFLELAELDSLRFVVSNTTEAGITLDEKDHFEAYNRLPKLITFSFAALFAFYRSNDLRPDGLYAKCTDGTEYVINDDEVVLLFFAQNSQKGDVDFVAAVASNTAFWGQDMTAYPQFTETVTRWLKALQTDPVGAVEEVLK